MTNKEVINCSCGGRVVPHPVTGVMRCSACGKKLEKKNPFENSKEAQSIFDILQGVVKGEKK